MGSESTDGLARLGGSGWFAALVDEAVARVLEVPDPGSLAQTPTRLGRLDRDLEDRLWSSGVLLGQSFDRRVGPVAGASDAENAQVELLRFLLADGATLVRRHAPALSPDKLRLQLASLTGAWAGELATAVVLEEAAAGLAPLAPRDGRRLFGVIGARLVRRAYLLGNPGTGLPLHAALAALELRAFTRLASAQLHRGGMLRRRAQRSAARLSQAKSLVIELFAAVLPPASAEFARTVPRQIRAAALDNDDRRRLLRQIEHPRPAAELVARLPPPLRLPVIEQLVLGALVQRRWNEEARARVTAMAAIAGLAPDLLASVELRAATCLVEHDSHARTLAAHHEMESLRGVLGGTVDRLHEAAARIAEELRETGELGVLLGRLAQGEKLDGEERRKVREQLIDLAKVVPGLAILAAPGGLILLPIVLRLLPFDLRPSAFRSGTKGAEPPRAA